MDLATILIVVLALVVAAVVGVVAIMQIQLRRSERLRRKFGPEYERILGASESRQAAEAELNARQQRVTQLRLREIAPDERERLSRAWERVQARFVEEPAAAVAEADLLVDEAMSARGYPIGDFHQRAADVSVDHSDVVSNYRSAQAIAAENEAGRADTEALRQAMIHYRALFSDLLGGIVSGDGADTSSTSRRRSRARERVGRA